MIVSIENGNLHIVLPMREPEPSGSGKTLLVASSNGNKPTTAEVNGKTVTVGVNAYISKN